MGAACRTGTKDKPTKPGSQLSQSHGDEANKPVRDPQTEFALAGAMDAMEERNHVFLARALARMENKFSRDHGDAANKYICRKSNLATEEVLWSAEDARRTREHQMSQTELGRALLQLDQNPAELKAQAGDWLLNMLATLVQQAAPAHSLSRSRHSQLMAAAGVSELLALSGFQRVGDEHVLEHGRRDKLLIVLDALKAAAGSEQIVCLEVSDPVDPLVLRRLLGLASAGSLPSLADAQEIVRQARALLSAEPNCNAIAAPSSACPVIVVGDLHGQLDDLRTIFDTVGYPSEDAVFVFNGDLVDRGAQGVEVMLVLLAAKAAFPKNVFINRGNHEDRLICRAYGFYKEAVAKYGEPMFEQLSGVFEQLPLACLIHETALVLHGGPASYSSMTVEQLNSIDRVSASTVSGLRLSEATLAEKVVSEILWSDPQPDDSGIPAIEPNHYRGLGVLYNLEHVAAWLDTLAVPFLVRSHECIELGCEELVMDERRSLFTVFSASDYDSSGNSGAVLRFKTPGQRPMVKSYVAGAIDLPGLKSKNRHKLSLLVAQNRFRLKAKHDAKLAAGEIVPKDGLLELDDWVAILSEVIQLNIQWDRWQSELCSATPDGRIDFEQFLRGCVMSMFRVDKATGHQKEIKGVQLAKGYPLIKLLFDYIDKDGNGTLEKEEFAAFMAEVNGEASDDEKIDAAALFDELDQNLSLIHISEPTRPY
eukprot:TRINITY_DN5651_c0_g1_i3.p1 TRINITY_DN5651_c0_g1~~TRINITY_DN5651_c0_g1_i3.p1  ORF type:complete len:708 (-),score=241.26 TRINITY_DN5651_c0_g1_i3:50-2173(-)